MYMEYITTTELRTKSPALVKALNDGKKVSLVHRSKVVGVIKPLKYVPKVFNAEKFKEALRALRPAKPISQSQGEKNYREHMMKKYGKYISRHK